MEATARRDDPISRITTIVCKEILDISRDTRTIVVTLITAMVAGPVLMTLVLNLIARQVDRVYELSLPVQGAEHAPALVEFLQRQQVMVTVPPTDFEGKIRSGYLEVVLEIDADFSADVASGKEGVVRLVYDRSRDRSLPAISEVERLLRSYNREWGGGRLMLRGIAVEVANPLNVEIRDLSTPQSAGALLLFLVAYYSLFAAVMGGMAFALDTTAGERERASLELLLMTPARPLELVAGKWLSVIAVGAITVILTLLGFYLVLRFVPLPVVGIPFLFGFAELSRFFITLVPLIILMPAIFLYIGIRAHSFKAAQSIVALLLMVVSLMPFAQMLLHKDEVDGLNWLPISGQYALILKALRGEVLPMVDLLQSFATPVLLTVAALAAVARLLAREPALAGRKAD